MKSPNIQKGDLVRSIKYGAIGIVVDIFADLDDKNPWVRVHFTSGVHTGSYQWCKIVGLEKIKKGSDKSGSL